MNWRLFALCRGMNPNIFFPGPYDAKGVERARKICNACPVRHACQDYGIEHLEKHGIWGGLTQRQLRSRRKKWKEKRAA